MANLKKDPSGAYAKNEALAGKTVYDSNTGQNVTFNDRGYFESARNPNTTGGTRAPHADSVLSSDRDQYGGSQYDKTYLSDKALAAIDNLRAQASRGEISWEMANWQANLLRSQYGYTGGDKGDQYIPTDTDTFLGIGTGDRGGSSYGGSGSTGQQMPQVDIPDFEEFLSQMGYDRYTEATQQRIQAAVQQAVNDYNAQIQQTNKDSDELARQAYVAKMLGQKNLDQQLSAAGYAGGMADSQRIQTQTNYENNLQDIENQRQLVVAELERAIQDAQLTGDLQAAQELQTYLQSMQSSWLSYVQNQQQMQNSNYWNQQQMQANQQQIDAEQTATAYNRALQLLGMGIMPGADLLAQAELSQQEAEAIRASVLAETGSGTAASSADSSRTSGGAYDNGSLSAGQVRQMQQALGVTADGMWGQNSAKAAGGLTADEAWAAMQRSLPASESGGGFSAMAYSSYLSRGQLDKADEYLARYWGSMTDSEKQTVNSLIKSYGY